ncbi:flagellar biosynthesis protein FliQ [Nitrosophilus alvini]|uniref:flagellar biosynthesis protein FliQ n=1 Tax=Nitrosophilus alvini TaxID=2714855 RepID=UPI001909A4F1|nr:flagellar biosynthesis protein FliQ [Nitrosophilus alvini]
MSIDQAITLIEQMLKTALMVGGPVLMTAFVVGVLISIFQAATQIQEMTITFIPKIVATVVAMIVFGSWMFMLLSEYIKETFQNLARILQ